MAHVAAAGPRALWRGTSGISGMGRKRYTTRVSASGDAVAACKVRASCGGAASRGRWRAAGGRRWRPSDAVAICLHLRRAPSAGGWALCAANSARVIDNARAGPSLSLAEHQVRQQPTHCTGSRRRRLGLVDSSHSAHATLRPGTRTLQAPPTAGRCGAPRPLERSAAALGLRSTIARHAPLECHRGHPGTNSGLVPPAAQSCPELPSARRQHVSLAACSYQACDRRRPGQCPCCRACQHALPLHAASPDAPAPYSSDARPVQPNSKYPAIQTSQASSRQPLLLPPHPRKQLHSA